VDTIDSGLSPFDLLFDRIGGAAFARKCGVTPQAADKWKKNRRVPGARVKGAVRVARAEGVDVSPHDLNPDLYPPGFEFPPEEAAP
jgi:DNA-binding transcriptional regulator YdaS (Cro superfamily)